MKILLLLIYLCYPQVRTKQEQQPLTVIFTDAIKKNILYLQFTDTQKKQWLFNAIKSESGPYVFYAT